MLKNKKICDIKLVLKIQIMLENISVKNNPLIGGALPTGSPKNNES